MTAATPAPTSAMGAASRNSSAATAPAKGPRRVNQSAIQPRRMDFRFDPDMPRYWFGGSQFKSLLLTALSCTFPEGERFFVRSVRHYQPQIRSELLKEEVKGFIGQEAHHGNEHEAFNALMQKKGIPTRKVEEFVLNGLKWQGKHMSPERQLAKTAALEHLTAMLAEAILENPDMLKGMHKDLFPLWLWHAVEESEHKSVAFDVYKEQVGSEWIRTSEMALTTVEFLGFTIFHYFQLRAEMEDKTDWASVRDGWKWLVGKGGVLRKLGPAYAAYYRRDFHPAKRDKRHLREQGLRTLARLLNRPELLEDAA